MTIRRPLPLALAVVAGVVVACSDSGTGLTSVPYGFLSFVAQKSGATHTASATGTFYSASGLGVPTSIDPWDSCRVQTYTPSSNTVGLGDIYPSLNAGAFIQVKLPARTDSLFPVDLGYETQYKQRSASGIPYTPGDSVSVVIPGNTGSKGFPAISIRAKTAEPFAVQDFSTPVAGTNIPLRWNAALDLNSTMVFSFRYAASGAASLNTQVYCQFRDDGADSIPTRFVASWVAATQHTWSAARVRTYVAPVARSGYFDFISTYDIPTPIAP